jgi:hypothetical protein
VSASPGRPTRRLFRRFALGVGLAGMLALPPASAHGACSAPPPLAATIFFQNPPANLTYSPTTPIVIVLQVQNCSGAPVTTTAGFAQSDFWRQLIFTTPTGGSVTNTAEALIHKDSPPLFCFSRQRVLQTPTAIPVVAAQVLATTFSTQFVIPVQQFYALTQSGRYTVNARIPLHTFTTSDPSAVITDCDQFFGQTVVNVAATTGRQAFTVLSNSLEFFLSLFGFSGFLPPLVNDSACATPPCHIFNLGRVVPVKFQLLNAAGTPTGTATATLSVFQLGGVPPAVPPTMLGVGAANPGNHFRFDPTSGQYVFNLNTRVLSRGVWRLDVHISDGSSQSMQIGLQ